MVQEVATYIWHLNKMEDLKIFGLYAANLFALAFSVSEINEYLQMLVMGATLTFTVIQIYKALKK
tara:strand:+ start:935 stop:1129 length:195 start_codon:yes stop_codon:yes gene_type:complete